MPASLSPLRTWLRAHGRTLRAAIPALSLVLGLVGMSSGVSLSEHPLAELSFWTRLYYALSLFVFGGVDLGMPVGGPAWGSAMLWTAYFFAPASTLFAVFEGTLRLLGSQALRMRRLRDHVVICGGGRLARLYIKRLRSADAKVAVVVIERDANRAMLHELREIYAVEVVIGDITSDETLAQVQVERARQVMLVTGDDFSNLDAAARLLAAMPALRDKVVAHVANLTFLRTLPDQSRAAGYETFNSLESAAIHLVQKRLLEVFAETAHRDLVVLAGFGRFGQTVLHQLRERANDQFGTVIVIDCEANSHVLRFANDAGFGDHDHHVFEGRLERPQVWESVDALITSDELGNPVFVIGTGDEGMNLQTAVDLRRRYPQAHITVRSFSESPFAREVSQQLELEPLVLAQLISSSMPARWFSA